MSADRPGEVRTVTRSAWIAIHFPNFSVGRSSIQLYADYGVLGPDIIFSHATEPLPVDNELLAKHGGFVSSTPDTEMQMGHGMPVCFNTPLSPFCSLGIDCHSNNSSDIMTQMRLALQSARAVRNQKIIDAGKLPRRVKHTVEDVFNLGTILGAKAVGMENEIGSLAVGKLADIVIFDGASPATACVAEENPIAAIVLHASIRDVDTVIVNGVIRKEKGQLTTVITDGKLENLLSKTAEGGKEWGWRDVYGKLREVRSRIKERTRGDDYEKIGKQLNKAMHIQEHLFVDDI
jgi:cytosine/adenosine deaminase-related metal-dependent hydrolase